MTPEEALDKAVEIAGSMQTLGGVLGVSKGAVSQWKTPGRQIPAEHCPSIERYTSGAVRCEDLRPDVDWAYLRKSAPAHDSVSPGRAGRNPPSAENIMQMDAGSDLSRRN